MKKRSLVAMLLVLAMTVCCLASCNNGNGGDSTEAGNTISLEVYDRENNLFLVDKAYAVTEGLTVRAAFEALCAARGYTVTFDVTGMFESFADDGEGEEKIVLKGDSIKEEGAETYTVYSLTWFYNDTDMSMKVPADTVVKAGDKIVVKFNVETGVEPAKV